MNFEVNDYVRELNDIGSGKVISVISSYKVVVLLNDGFERTYNTNELVKVQEPHVETNMYGLNEERIDLDLIKEMEQKLRDHNKKAFTNNKPDKTNKRRGIDMEIDLHIENLLDSHYGMTNGEIIQVQLSVFERMLKRAISKRMRKIVFIHGVGQGVLRAEIRRLLSDFYPSTDFYDADYLKYGVGGTEVLIRYH